MESQSQLFFIFFSLCSVLAVAAVHFFIKEKLGDKHDNGLLWVAGALFVWFLMGLLEFHYAGFDPRYLAEHYRELWPYWYGRKALSIFNSALFVYSLSYFRDGWLRLHKWLEKINLGMLAIITIGLCFATFPLEPRIWLLTDTLVSVAVALLLCLSIAAIFYQRGLHVMAVFALVVCFFLVYTQVTELLKDPNFAAQQARSWLDDRLIRMLSRPSLVICILVLAISWLGSQLEEEVVSRAPGRLANSLRFETRGIRNYVTMSLQTEDFHLQNLVFDFTHRPSPYAFFKRCAERALAGENFHRDEFTDNFDTMVKRLLEPINQKLADEGFGYSLQKGDLFLRDSKGIYRLVFEKQEISV
ncbi:MAG: hypothetical protein IT260_03265 [Saprospiraceae bacterium]|nr:hypothetical protein [Saprospiraceae bacterium]